MDTIENEIIKKIAAYLHVFEKDDQVCENHALEIYNNISPVINFYKEVIEDKNEEISRKMGVIRELNQGWAKFNSRLWEILGKYGYTHTFFSSDDDIIHGIAELLERNTRLEK